MASWMVHLRVADKLLDAIPGLSPIEFIMGNMAPDSGIPNADWSSFSPSTKISHFRTDDGTGKKQIDLDAYRTRYFSPALIAGYDAKAYSFYLGYYTHLLTDRHWSDLVAAPTKAQFPGTDWWKIKEDWYDQDFLYLKKHPGFRAFRAYLGSVGFVNRYMDFFAADAFDDRRAYITSFYLQENDRLDREYPYFTEAQADDFVKTATARILAQLKEEL